MKEGGEEYLGDGLYARIEGTLIILRAPRAGGDHWVGLEIEVFSSLIRFAYQNGWSRIIQRTIKQEPEP